MYLYIKYIFIYHLFKRKKQEKSWKVNKKLGWIFTKEIFLKWLINIGKKSFNLLKVQAGTRLKQSERQLPLCTQRCWQQEEDSQATHYNMQWPVLSWVPKGDPLPISAAPAVGELHRSPAVCPAGSGSLGLPHTLNLPSTQRVSWVLLVPLPRLGVLGFSQGSESAPTSAPSHLFLISQRSHCIDATCPPVSQNHRHVFRLSLSLSLFGCVYKTCRSFLARSKSSYH